MIIMGDYNIDHLKDLPRYWSEALEEFDLTQIITAPTRVTDKTSTLIDLIYTNKPQNICENRVPVIAISDHYPVCITRNSSRMSDKKKRVEIRYRDFKHFNEGEFLFELTQINFETLMSSRSSNEILEISYEKLFSVVEKHAKPKSKRVKSQYKPKWISNEINEARYKRDMYHKRLDMENYRIWRNKVTKLIREAKTKYYQKAIEENQKVGDIWKCLKELVPKNSCNGPHSLNINGQTFENEADIANAFNEFFSNLAKRLTIDEADASPSLEKLSNYIENKIPMTHRFRISPIEEDQVFKLLSKLNISKASGIDTLGPRLLKIAAPMIYKPLCHLINVSIETGMFPDELKIGKLTPIFKKGNKCDPGNYRPISILPTISKIVERHVASELKEFLHEYELINIHQSGLRQFHSCQTALTKMTDLWLKDIDDGKLTGATFIDFTKAFDLVDHKLLLKKLAPYKFDESTLLWFKSYLSNRKQSVHVGGSKSKQLDVVSGVPQGSVLGPLLFLVYINDLPLHVEKSKLDLFADDVTLHSSSADMNVIENHLNCDIEKKSTRGVYKIE